MCLCRWSREIKHKTTVAFLEFIRHETLKPQVVGFTAKEKGSRPYKTTQVFTVTNYEFSFYRRKK